MGEPPIPEVLIWKNWYLTIVHALFSTIVFVFIGSFFISAGQEDSLFRDAVALIFGMLIIMNIVLWIRSKVVIDQSGVTVRNYLRSSRVTFSNISSSPKNLITPSSIRYFYRMSGYCAKYPCLLTKQGETIILGPVGSILRNRDSYDDVTCYASEFILLISTMLEGQPH